MALTIVIFCAPVALRRVYFYRRSVNDHQEQYVTVQNKV